jgi:hypothetical protein
MGKTLLVKTNVKSSRAREHPESGANGNSRGERGRVASLACAFAGGGLAARCSPVLAVIRAAGARAIGGKEPRDIRVVLVRSVPGRAFIADEVARRGGARTVIDA